MNADMLLILTWLSVVWEGGVSDLGRITRLWKSSYSFYMFHMGMYIPIYGLAQPGY